MYIRCGKPPKGIKGRLTKDFYLNMELANGKSFFRKFSLSAIENNDFFNLLLECADNNYKTAIKKTDEVYGGFFNTFIGMYCKMNDHLVAHTLFSTELNSDGQMVAVIDEIHIANKDQLTSGDEDNFDFVRGIYNQMLKYIEEEVVTYYNCYYSIEIRSVANDGRFWNVCQSLGYEITDSGDLPNNTYRFEKKLLERPKMYERCNPNK